MLITIQLKAMRFYAFHGVLAQENRVGGDYQVDLKLQVNVDAEAYLHDNLQGTLNYAQVYEHVRMSMNQPSQLLEHAAYRMAKSLLQQFQRIAAVDITLTKVNPPIGGSLAGASVNLTLPREQS